MRDLFRLIGWTVVDLFRSRAALEAEIWTLRQQINVLRKTAPKKLSFRAIDRLGFVCLYRLFPNARDALAIVKPDTILRWRRAGFRSYWCWKSRPRGGRPTVPPEIRRVIREMSIMFSVLTPTKTIGPQIQSQNRDEMNAGFRKAAYTAIGQ
jgi:hypothetical protein